MRAALAVLLAAPVFPALAQDPSPRTPQEMHHLHRDAQAYIAMLEDPARDAYQKPNEVVAALGLKAGEVVADVGAGSGYFAVRLAQSVGPTGAVYAVDISPEMIVHLNRRIRDAGIQNVQTILAAPDDPLLRDASVDRFFVCDTWHHIADQEAYLTRMKRMLRPGGLVVMIDFQKRELPLGPPLAMKIAREDLIRQMEGAGFELLREHTFLPYQYFLVFTLKPSGKA
ncbi:MAG TPA: methyltransferase domain-containing protein [Vicinamibacteria bacterium]|nr:methyltransferase domain-containing protein [Vicinamibacteria bacterium]